MNTIIDITKCTGEELRHFAYLADQRAQRAEERMAEMFHRPALGAFISQVGGGPDLNRSKAWEDALSRQEAHHLAHPEELAVIVEQIAEWTDDKELIARASVLHAERCGIPKEIFIPVIKAALQGVRSGN